MFKIIRSPFFNTEGQQGGGAGTGTPGTPPQTVKIGDKDYTTEELQTKLTGYEKLEKQFTKVSQENSDLRKVSDSAKDWLNFEQVIKQLPENVQQQFVKQTNDFFVSAQAGTLTQQDISGINKAIKTAEKAGDSKAADALEGARDEAVQAIWLNEQYEELEELAENDGIPFKKKEFKTFLTKYLEDEGYTDEDDITKRDIRAAYKLYVVEKKAKASDEERKNNLPNFSTGSSGIGVGNKNTNDKGPKTIKEATQRMLSGNQGK